MNKIKSQKTIWELEHSGQKTFTRMHNDKPSSPVVNFSNFIKEKLTSLKDINVLDIGCGNGRNSFYLAAQNFSVIGLDFSAKAINKAKGKTKENTDFFVADLGNKWNFADNYFDAIIDCNATICIPNPGREKSISESYRVLKPGGYYLFYGIAPTTILKRSPGPEINSGIFPSSGKFEKQYSERELKESYNKFQIVSLEKIKGKDTIEGKSIVYNMWVMVLKKSK